MKQSEKMIHIDYHFKTWDKIDECKKRFLHHHEDPTKMPLISPEVAKSWIRSKNWGVDPYAPILPDNLERTEVQALLENNERLIKTAIPVIEKILPLLAISNYVVILTDKDGTVLFSSRDRNYLAPVKEMNFQVGFAANEKNIGTTATCLSILHQRPLQLLGPSNYLVLLNHALSSSAPIFNEQKEVIGSLGLVQSLEKQNSEFMHKHSLDWVTSVADCVSQLWELTLKNHHLEAVNSLQKKALSFIDQGIIPINKEGIRAESKTGYTFHDILGKSEVMQRAISMAKKISQTQASVLLYGESGTGKELFAQAIHHNYTPEGPFIAINCASIPKNLIESELFGYEGGAFTGAEKKGRPGKFELASGGTIFLDEIGDMPMEIEPVLLRADHCSDLTAYGVQPRYPMELMLAAQDMRQALNSAKAIRDFVLNLASEIV